MNVARSHALSSNGFNLLPYRSRRRREARNRRLAALAGAAFVGGLAAGGVAVWEGSARARLDQGRLALQSSLDAMAAPLAEHARLVGEDGRQKAGRERAAPLAAARERFFVLLDALGGAQLPGGVTLQRISQRADEVELQALAADSQTAARWLKQLESVRDVRSVEVVEMRRHVAPARHATSSVPAGAYEFMALVRWGMTQAAKAPRTTGRSVR